MTGDLLGIATRVVGWADSAEHVDVFTAHASETEARAHGGEVESLTSASSQGVGIRVVNGGRQGFSYAAALDDETLRDTFNEARDNCRFSSFDEFAGVAAPDGVQPVHLDLYRPGLDTYDPEKKVALALELERATLAADPRISGVETAEYADSVYSAAVATSSGVAAEASETGCSLSVHSLAEDRGETQTGFGFSVGRHPDELSVETAAADAAERATRMLGAVKLPTGHLSVVLDPYVTAQLIAIIGSTLSGDAVLKGRSMFADRMGEEVGDASLTLIDDATDPDAYTASAIDAEGLATRRVPLIADGVLRAFLYDTYTARRAGTVSTGSAVRGGFAGTPSVGARALTLLPGARQQADIVSGIDDGLLVQGVVGLHSGVNPVSGDFSVGAEGLRIRDGATAEPVREVTIASTIQKLMRNVIEVGADLERLPMHASGVSLAIADVAVSGL